SNEIGRRLVPRGLEGLPRRPAGRVISDSFLNALHHLDARSVDLIVTSPPYVNNYHYVRNTRPQLFWLGFVRKPSELKQLETQNFGKYWQTSDSFSTILKVALVIPKIAPP